MRGNIKIGASRLRAPEEALRDKRVIIAMCNSDKWPILEGIDFRKEHSIKKHQKSFKTDRSVQIPAGSYLKDPRV